VFIRIPEAKLTVNYYNANCKFKLFSNIRIVLANVTSSEKKVMYIFSQDFLSKLYLNIYYNVIFQRLVHIVTSSHISIYVANNCGFWIR
jgi:hypothetical protein